jgi:hypothetical protein
MLEYVELLSSFAKASVGRQHRKIGWAFVFNATFYVSKRT